MLAYSEKCPVQAYRFGNRVYSMQFHPELSIEDLEYRLSLYPEYKDNALGVNEGQNVGVKKLIGRFVREWR